jgi:hypothetical protein
MEEAHRQVGRLAMSVKARLEDAVILWDRGRKEGAWALVLVAAAATSRKRYPRPMRDNGASASTWKSPMRKHSEVTASRFSMVRNHLVRSLP